MNGKVGPSITDPRQALKVGDVIFVRNIENNILAWNKYLNCWRYGSYGCEHRARFSAKGGSVFIFLSFNPGDTSA